MGSWALVDGRARLPREVARAPCRARGGRGPRDLRVSGDRLLAIDHGTQSVRALLFDLSGNLVARSRVLIEPYVSASRVARSRTRSSTGGRSARRTRGLLARRSRGASRSRASPSRPSGRRWSTSDREGPARCAPPSSGSTSAGPKAIPPRPRPLGRRVPPRRACPRRWPTSRPRRRRTGSRQHEPEIWREDAQVPLPLRLPHAPPDRPVRRLRRLPGRLRPLRLPAPPLGRAPATGSGTPLPVEREQLPELVPPGGRLWAR